MLLILISLVIVLIVFTLIGQNNPLKLVINMFKTPDLKYYWSGTLTVPNGNLEMILVITEQKKDYIEGLLYIGSSPEKISGHVEKNMILFDDVGKFKNFYGTFDNFGNVDEIKGVIKIGNILGTFTLEKIVKFIGK